MEKSFPSVLRSPIGLYALAMLYAGLPGLHRTIVRLVSQRDG